MTASTLRAVTLKTVANYTHAAERAVVAYRVGGQRLIAAMQRGVDLAAQNGPERLALALRRAGGNVGGLATQGLDRVSSQAERAIEIGSSGVSTRLARVADIADGVGNDIVATGLQAAARVSLPGAQVALALSVRVVAGADRLPGAPVARAGAQVLAAVARGRKAAKLQAPVNAVVAKLERGAGKARKATAPVAAEVKAAVKPRAVRKTATQPAAQAIKRAAPAGASRARRAGKAGPAAQTVEAVQGAAA